MNAPDWSKIKWTASPRRQARKHLNTFPLPVRLCDQFLYEYVRNSNIH